MNDKKNNIPEQLKGFMAKQEETSGSKGNLNSPPSPGVHNIHRMPDATSAAQTNQDNEDQVAEIPEEVSAVLTEVIREALHSPATDSVKALPIARALLKAKILELKDITPTNVELATNRFKGIWDYYKLGEHKNMMFLNNAINGEIIELKNLPGMIEKNEKALEILDKIMPNDVNTFGAGHL